jgi:hypothetical protein
MDLSVNSVSALEKVASALTEAAAAVDGEANTPRDVAATTPSAIQADTNTVLARGGFVERLLGETLPVTTALPAEQPGVRADKSIESATMQTLARPHAAVPEPARPSDTAPSPGAQANAHSGSDFAMPAALLVPATLIGLQVQHAGAWPMPGRGFDPDADTLHQVRRRERDVPPPPPPIEQEPDEPAQDAAPEQTDTHSDDAHTCGVVFEDGDDGAWCDELSRALHIALAARIAPRALLLAAEQWRRGRCVVLACPQHADPAGPAWAFVLWPRKPAPRKPDAPAAPLALFGLRVEARLQWSSIPGGARWCHTRVIKEHHPRSGRQLIPSTPSDQSARVPCEVQLGPVLARPLRCCDVCVRINAARRFWNALGAQWSMQVIVAPQPLIGDGTAVKEDA